MVVITVSVGIRSRKNIWKKGFNAVIRLKFVPFQSATERQTPNVKIQNIIPSTTIKTLQIWLRNVDAENHTPKIVRALGKCIAAAILRPVYAPSDEYQNHFKQSIN